MSVSIVTLNYSPIYVNYSIRGHRKYTRKISFSSLTGIALYVDSEMMLDRPTPLQPVEQQKRQHSKGNS